MSDNTVGLFVVSLPLLMVLLAFIVKGRLFKRVAILSLIGMALFRPFFYVSVSRFPSGAGDLRGLSWEAYRDGVGVMTDFYTSTMLFPIVIAILFAVLFFRSMRDYGTKSDQGVKAASRGSE